MNLIYAEFLYPLIPSLLQRFPESQFYGVGDSVEVAVGVTVGTLVEVAVGIIVGALVGALVGAAVGIIVGALVGPAVGAAVGGRVAASGGPIVRDGKRAGLLTLLTYSIAPWHAGVR